MTKQEAEKELVHVVNDICNPYNNRESEIEAYLLAEEGWRKVPQAEWIPIMVTDPKYRLPVIVGFTCSNCRTKQEVNTNYCSFCGAEMVIRKCFDDDTI